MTSQGAWLKLTPTCSQLGFASQVGVVCDGARDAAGVAGLVNGLNFDDVLALQQRQGDLKIAQHAHIHLLAVDGDAAAWLHLAHQLQGGIGENRAVFHVQSEWPLRRF